MIKWQRAFIYTRRVNNMDKMTKEHLASLLINGTSEQIQEAIDDIHPADILDVLQDHHSQLNNILSKHPQ